MIELLGFRGRYGKNQRILTNEELNETYNYDFSWKNVIVEFQGSYWHGNTGNMYVRGGKNIETIKARDLRKKTYAMSCGYRYLEVHEKTFRIMRENPAMALA